MAPPGFNENLGFLQGVEALPVQELVAQPRVEALDVAVLPRRTRFDEGGPGADRSALLLDGPAPCRNRRLNVLPRSAKVGQGQGPNRSE